VVAVADENSLDDCEQTDVVERRVVVEQSGSHSAGDDGGGYAVAVDAGKRRYHRLLVRPRQRDGGRSWARGTDGGCHRGGDGGRLGDDQQRHWPWLPQLRRLTLTNNFDEPCLSCEVEKIVVNINGVVVDVVVVP